MSSSIAYVRSEHGDTAYHFGMYYMGDGERYVVDADLDLLLHRAGPLSCVYPHAMTWWGTPGYYERTLDRAKRHGLVLRVCDDTLYD